MVSVALHLELASRQENKSIKTVRKATFYAHTEVLCYIIIILLFEFQQFNYSLDVKAKLG